MLFNKLNNSNSLMSFNKFILISKKFNQHPLLTARNSNKLTKKIKCNLNFKNIYIT